MLYSCVTKKQSIFNKLTWTQSNVIRFSLWKGSTTSIFGKNLIRWNDKAVLCIFLLTNFVCFFIERKNFIKGSYSSYF